MNEGERTKGADSLPRRLTTWSPWILLGLAVGVGIWARIVLSGQTVVADELSTLWIVDSHTLGEVIDFVYGDAEISPPFYFTLAWLASKLGSAPELIRLPSVVAGVVSLPLFYLIGNRLFDRRVGILAACFAALSPMLIYNAATGRAYSVAFLFVLASTLALVYAVGDGRRRWWVAYALFSCLAMYTHYTAAFVLVGQAVWALVYFPAARKALILANLGAAILYLPWVPGYFADSDSPTTPILEALQGQGFEAKKSALEQVLFWRVRAEAWSIGSRWDVALLSLGLVVAAVGASIGVVRRTGIVKWLRNLDPAVVLVLILVLATPVGAFILGRFSTDVFGTRNLAMLWVGLPIAIAAAVTAAGRVWGLTATVLVTSGLLIGTVDLTDGSRTELPFKQTGEYIEAQIRPGDSVVSTTVFTPAPLTPLEIYLDADTPKYQIGLPTQDPPFLPGDTLKPPDPAVLWGDALRDSDRIFLVMVGGETNLTEDRMIFVNNLYVAETQLPVPPGWKIGRPHEIDGILPISVTVLERERKSDD